MATKRNKTGGGKGTNGHKVKGTAKRRDGAGTPKAAAKKAAAKVEPKAKKMPMEDWGITGISENVIQYPDGSSQAGGTCSHCGTGIRYTVIIEHIKTGDKRVIGRDCAVRTGMNEAQIKELNRELFAEKRRKAAELRSAGHRKKNFLTAEEHDQDQVDAVLEHRRFAADIASTRLGKPADDLTPEEIQLAMDRKTDFSALEVAHDLYHGGRVWKDNLERASGRIEGWEMPPFKPELTMTTTAAFDLEGNLLTANLRSTRYGMSYFYTDDNGRNVWLSPSKAKKPETRRTNNAKKGFYVGLISAEAAPSRSGGTWIPKDDSYQPERIVSIEDNGLHPEIIEQRDHEEALERASWYD